MTFASRTFFAMANGGPIGFSGGVSNNSAATGVRSGSFQINSDGTTQSTRLGVSNVVGSPWYAPLPAPGIGASYWCKMTINSSTGTTSSGSFGTVLSLSGNINWGFTSSGPLTEGVGNATLNIYGDAGGTSLLASANVSWDVGYTP